MGVFPLLVCVLLVAEPAAMGQPTTTTAASADPANVSTSHVSEDDPTTSATHLNATPVSYTHLTLPTKIGV